MKDIMEIQIILKISEEAAASSASIEAAFDIT
jgi:hypothetical protein